MVPSGSGAGALGACAGGGGASGSALGAALAFFAASQCSLKEPWPPQAEAHNGSWFDFVVVGGGTGGAALASRLAEAGASVLLLEAGKDPPQEAIIPGFRGALHVGPYNWNFTTADDQFSSQALAGGSQRQPRGHMLGGSGSLNDMVYARGFPADYDEWASLLGDHWSWDSVLEYFKKTEHMTDEKITNDPDLMKYHGRGGAIEVSGLNESTFDTDTFLSAFKELGYKIVDDMTYPHVIGAGRFSHTIRSGRRDSSLTALLNKAATGSNLLVLRDALVSKVLIENNTAYGVQVLSNQQVLQFYARKEVILSAGTFNTPKLLLLSGIGPKEHLESLDIDVVVDLPVGDNLHDHVMVLDYIAAANGTCPSDQAAVHMNMIRYLYDQTGSFSVNNGMGAYLSLNASQPNVPDFAFYPSCMPMNTEGFFEGCSNVLGFKPNICSKLQALNKDHELISVAVVLLKPSSRGKVRLNSTNPLDKPIIYSGTFNNSEDLDGYPEAMSVVRALANTTYLKWKGASVVEFDIEGCEGGDGVEAVKCRVRALAMSAWHAAGSAPMGVVLDSRLRVLGVRDLRVVDASVMPTVVRGNTNAPVVMIAEKAADFIKQGHGL